MGGKRFSLTQDQTRERVAASLARRYRQEYLFRLYGLVSIVIGVGFLVFLFSSIIGNGYSAFWQTYIQLEVAIDEQVVDPDGSGKPVANPSGD